MLQIISRETCFYILCISKVIKFREAAICVRYHHKHKK